MKGWAESVTCISTTAGLPIAVRRYATADPSGDADSGKYQVPSRPRIETRQGIGWPVAESTTSPRTRVVGPGVAAWPWPAQPGKRTRKSQGDIEDLRPARRRSGTVP